MHHVTSHPHNQEGHPVLYVKPVAEGIFMSFVCPSVCLQIRSFRSLRYELFLTVLLGTYFQYPGGQIIFSLSVSSNECALTCATTRLQASRRIFLEIVYVLSTNVIPYTPI